MSAVFRARSRRAFPERVSLSNDILLPGAASRSTPDRIALKRETSAVFFVDDPTIPISAPAKARPPRALLGAIARRSAETRGSLDAPVAFR